MLVLLNISYSLSKLIIGKTKGFIRGKALSVEGHTHNTDQIDELQNYVQNLIDQSAGTTPSFRYQSTSGTGTIKFSFSPTFVLCCCSEESSKSSAILAQNTTDLVWITKETGRTITLSGNKITGLTGDSPRLYCFAFLF